MSVARLFANPMQQLRELIAIEYDHLPTKLLNTCFHGC
jgi:hypothetical protein